MAGFAHCQEIRGPQVAPPVRPRSQGARHLYFTNHTLTGKQNAFPFQGSESGLSARVGLLVKLFSRGACHLYFTNRALTGNESLSPLLTPEADRVATCPSQLQSPNFFHRSHFDWEPERFSVAAFGFRQAIPQAELSATPSFARCSPSLFHQSHFDWEQSPATPKRGFVWTYSSRISVVAGFLTAKKFRTTKCAL